MGTTKVTASFIDLFESSVGVYVLDGVSEMTRGITGVSYTWLALLRERTSPLTSDNKVSTIKTCLFRIHKISVNNGGSVRLGED